MEQSMEVPEPQTIGAFTPVRNPVKPQEYHDRIKQKFAGERDLRLKYRPEGTAQYTSDLIGALAKYEVDPYGVARSESRATTHDCEDCGRYDR